MADRGKKEETGVLGSLPATRPARLSRRAANGSKPAARKAASRARKPTARKAVAKKTTKKVASSPRPAPVLSAAEVTGRRPRAVRPGSRGLEEAIAHSERPRNEPPSGTELVSTVVKAAGEVAQIGLTVGGQILRRAVERLPKP